MTSQPQQQALEHVHIITAQKAVLAEQTDRIVTLRASINQTEANAQALIDSLVGKINGVQSRLAAEFKDSTPEVYDRISTIFDEVIGEGSKAPDPQG